MSDPTVQLTRKQVDPTLRDLLNLLKKDILLSLNCHAVATVQSFNATKQTVQATLNYKKSFSRAGADGVYRIVLEDYPILLDVPVIVLGGGLAQITFPIAKGDECLILFNDRDIDNWFKSGQVVGVASGRLHSFSDGIALVGLNSAPNALANYDTTRAVLAYGSTLVGVGASKIKIGNAGTTLNTVLQDLLSNLQTLITDIKALTVVCASAGSPSSAPVNSAAFTAVANSLSTTATNLAGLLE